MVDWERNWRSNGIVAAVLFFVAFAIYGRQPKVGASAEKLLSYYDGGGYALFIPTLVMLVWLAVVSGFLVRRYSAAVKTPERAVVASGS